MARFSGSTYSAAVDESKRLIALATLGNTQVDMSDYYNRTDSDNKFAAKVDLDTLTTSHNDLKTVHDTHVADSVAHLTQDERDKILTIDDIATSISTNPSNNKVTSEKVVNDLLQTEGSGNLTIPLNEDLNNLIYNRTRVWMNSQTDQIAAFTNKPSGQYEECAVIFIPYENTTDSFGEQIFVGNTNRIFIRNKFHTEWTAWRRVCTTSVEDVPMKFINVVDGSTNYTNHGDKCAIYYVKNGICEVTLCIDCITPSNETVNLLSGLPKANAYSYFVIHAWNTGISDYTMAEITPTGTLNVKKGTSGGYYLGTFSYIVKE